MAPGFQSMATGSLAAAPGVLGLLLEVVHGGMKCSRNSFRDPVKRRPRFAGSTQTKHHLHVPASMWPTSPGRAATSRDTPDVPWGGVEPAQACRFLSRTVVIFSHPGLGVVCYVATDALQSQTQQSLSAPPSKYTQHSHHYPSHPTARTGCGSPAASQPAPMPRLTICSCENCRSHLSTRLCEQGQILASQPPPPVPPSASHGEPGPSQGHSCPEAFVLTAG